MIIQNYLEIPNKTFHKIFAVSNTCCCISINLAYTLYAIYRFGYLLLELLGYKI